MRYLTLLLLLFTLVHCSVPIYGLRYTQTVDQVPPKKVALIVLDEGMRDGYQKSFETKFTDVPGFCLAMEQQMLPRFLAYAPAEVIHPSPEELVLLKKAVKYPDIDQEALAQYFASLDPEYEQICIMRYWQIYRNYEQGAPMYMPGPAGTAGTWSGSGQQSYCVVSLTGGLFHRQGFVLEHGQSKRRTAVFMFAFASALESATADSCQTFVDLLTHRLPEENIKTGPPVF